MIPSQAFCSRIDLFKLGLSAAHIHLRFGLGVVSLMVLAHNASAQIDPAAELFDAEPSPSDNTQVFDPTSLKLRAAAGELLEFRLPKVNSKLPTVRFGTQDLLVKDESDEWLIIAAIGSDVLTGEYLLYFKYDAEDAKASAIPLTVYVQRGIDTRAQEKQASATQSSVSSDSSTHRWPRSLSDLDFENSSEPNFPFLATLQEGLALKQTIVTHDRVNKPAIALSALITENHVLRAPSQGIVTKLLSEQGQATILIVDHGRSVFSVFSFVGKPLVALGSGVSRGEPLAQLLGASSTRQDNQSQLYWWVSLNNAIVSPELLID